MKLDKLAVLSVLASLMLIAVIACSPPAPVTLDNIAVPSGAQPTTNSIYTQLQTAVVDGLKNSQDVKIENVDSRIYTAARDAQWSDIEKFYDGEMGKGDWKTDPKLTATNTSVHGKGWLRGQQVFAVFFISDPNVPDALLLTALGNVKQ